MHSDLELNLVLLLINSLIVSQTLMIVIITTIVLGGLMASVAKMIGLSYESIIDTHDFIARTTYHQESRIIEDEKDKSLVISKWKYFDQKYIKNIFGGHLENIATNENENDNSQVHLGESRDFKFVSSDSQANSFNDESNSQISIELVNLKSKDK